MPLPNLLLLLPPTPSRRARIGRLKLRERLLRRPPRVPLRPELRETRVLHLILRAYALVLRDVLAVRARRVLGELRLHVRRRVVVALAGLGCGGVLVDSTRVSLRGGCEIVAGQVLRRGLVGLAEGLRLGG